MGLKVKITLGLVRVYAIGHILYFLAKQDQIWLVLMQSSSAKRSILQEYTAAIQRFSVDESFLDFTNMKHLYPDYMELANRI